MPTAPHPLMHVPRAEVGKVVQTMLLDGSIARIQADQEVHPDSNLFTITPFVRPAPGETAGPGGEAQPVAGVEPVAAGDPA